MTVGNFDPRIWSRYLLGEPRDLWRHPIPAGQLHEPIPATLNARAAQNRRSLNRYRRSRIRWNLRAPLRYLGRLGGLTDGDEQ